MMFPQVPVVEMDLETKKEVLGLEEHERHNLGADNHTHINNNINEETLLLPRCPPQWKHVHNECIICWDSYQCGDVLVWSNNPQCQHAYHHECMMEYLMIAFSKTRRGNTPCPVCRRPFVV
jgi:hypothetical protein